MMTNRDLLSNLFTVIVQVMRDTTSYTYAKITLINKIKQYIDEFPFIQYIIINKSEEDASYHIEIGQQIEDVEPAMLAMFITKLINSLFVSDSVRSFISDKLQEGDSILYSDLEAIGVIL